MSQGPIDGIGGATKRFVWNRVISREIPEGVYTAAQFVAAASGMEKVNVELLTEEYIKDVYEDLDLEELFADAPSITGISKVHCFTVTHGNILRIYNTDDEYRYVYTIASSSHREAQISHTLSQEAVEEDD